MSLTNDLRTPKSLMHQQLSHNEKKKKISGSPPTCCATHAPSSQKNVKIWKANRTRCSFLQAKSGGRKHARRLPRFSSSADGSFFLSLSPSCLGPWLIIHTWQFWGFIVPAASKSLPTHYVFPSLFLHSSGKGGYFSLYMFNIHRALLIRHFVRFPAPTSRVPWVASASEGKAPIYGFSTELIKGSSLCSSSFFYTSR